MFFMFRKGIKRSSETLDIRNSYPTGTCKYSFGITLHRVNSWPARRPKRFEVIKSFNLVKHRRAGSLPLSVTGRPDRKHLHFLHSVFVPPFWSSRCAVLSPLYWFFTSSPHYWVMQCRRKKEIQPQLACSCNNRHIG